MELSIKAAAAQVFPQAKLTTCYWHVTEAWRRNMVSHGLTSNDPIAQHYFKLLKSLAFLDMSNYFVSQAAQEIIADLVNQAQNPNLTTHYYDYIRKNYLELGNVLSRPAAKYSPVLWSLNVQTCVLNQSFYLTNNPNEQTHSALKKKIHGPVSFRSSVKAIHEVATSSISSFLEFERTKSMGKKQSKYQSVKSALLYGFTKSVVSLDSVSHNSRNYSTYKEELKIHMEA